MQDAATEAQLPLLANIFSFILMSALAIWELWMLVIAFVGGRLPIPFVEWDIQGGIFTGLLFLFIIIPILSTVLFQAIRIVLLIVLLPFFARS